ncbi:MAG: hypothetical protein KF814_05220 [Nitrospiraceae bacterium]|nr:hypothetical protein [Nitrospiraceae bacterium]
MSLRRSHSVPYSLIAISVLALDWGIASTGNAAPIRQGTGADATCEVVSVGQWYCTIDGKGYYCDTNNNPDKNKNCRPARIAPTGPKGNLNQGMLRNQQIMRRGVEGDATATEGEAGKDSSGDVKERSVKRPTPRPAPPVPPKGPNDPQIPPIGPGGTGPTIPR